MPAKTCLQTATRDQLIELICVHFHLFDPQQPRAVLSRMTLDVLWHIARFIEVQAYWLVRSIMADETCADGLIRQQAASDDFFGRALMVYLQ